MNRKFNLLVLATIVIVSATFSLAIAEAKDKDDEEEEKEEQRKDEIKLGEAMGLAERFNLAEKIEFCHYMIDTDYLKETTNCVEYAQDPNFEERSKNFMIMKGYGLYK